MTAYLIASLLVLLVGPLVVGFLRRMAHAAVFLDAFVIVSVGGLVLTEILPESLRQAGPAAGLALIAGLFVPLLAERGLFSKQVALSRTLLWIGFLGLATHAFVDGLAFVEAHQHAHEGPDAHHDHGAALAIAVILHRLPVGIAIWWLLPNLLGVRAAIGTLLLIAVTTVLGAFCGNALLTDVSTPILGVVQALLAGSLLHVVFHAHLPLSVKPGQGSWASALGTLLALGTLVGVALSHGDHGPDHAHGAAHGTGDIFLSLALQSAPALLFAYAAVGLLHAWKPTMGLRVLEGKRPLGQALRGMLVGLPLPLCSCGIVPVFRDLVRRGAPVAASVAFLVATPELEIAAFFLSLQLLGPDLALLRLAAAAFLSVLAALLVARTVRKHAASTPQPTMEGTIVEASDHSAWRRFTRSGFVNAVDDTAGWILLGLGLAAVLQPMVDPAWLAALPEGVGVLVAAMIGLPLYVCASGSTPLAAAMIAMGLSPGAALTFLLTGPATNLTTFGVVRNTLGRPAAWTFAVCMTGGAIGLGLLTDLLWTGPTLAEGFDAQSAHVHNAPLYEWCALFLLTALFALAIWRKGTRPFVEQLFAGPKPQPTEEAACASEKASCCH